MKEDKKHASKELPNAPHFAKRSGLDVTIENWLTSWKGRTDASTTPPDSTGHHPLTRNLQTHVDHVEARIHDSLISALRPIDNEIVRLEAQIRRFEENKQSVLQKINSHPPKSEEANTPQGQESLRHRDKLLSENAATATREDALAIEVVRLIEDRDKIHEAAIAILNTWQARCAALIYCHRRAFIRKATVPSGRRKLTLDNPQALPVPSHTPTHLWATGARMPITTTKVSTEDPVLSWTHRS
ncbi:hypothetical protein [Arthrobacter sp. OY3WO11]|uniref:hypothetical protein n=1 Tax=Arthrobacter sp. OY3WO11 TaxID=1835723 RepID=UPI000ABE2C2B|nr:hypothetical protein [Arthrobacter sp. OY3WO11]